MLPTSLKAKVQAGKTGLLGHLPGHFTQGLSALVSEQYGTAGCEASGFPVAASGHSLCVHPSGATSIWSLVL